MKQRSVVLWTRISPQTEEAANEDNRIPVRYAVCRSSTGDAPEGETLFPQRGCSLSARLRYRSRCRVGWTTTGAFRDFTVKAEPSFLPPGNVYYYQFQVAFSNKFSEMGRTRTLPEVTEHVESLTYAVMSCASMPHGYFHAYELLANAEKLDLWLHVGDYQYEYGSYTYPSPDNVVRQEPFGPYREITTLSEYRQRYALYREDRSLQKLHRRAGMYAIWDDHEITNDARSDGAENHQTTCDTPADPPFATLTTSSHCDKDEGVYDERVAAATRAYFEWLPVSEAGGVMDDPEARKTRSFEVHFGDLISFAGYDTRVSTRTVGDPTDLTSTANHLVMFAAMNANVSAWYEEPLASALAAAADLTKNDLIPTAEVMGEAKRESMRTFFAESTANGAPWQVLATPIPMGERSFPDFIKSQETLIADLMAYGADAVTAATIAGTYDAINTAAMATDAQFRLSQASGMTHVPWNSDAWDGYAFEREKVLQIFAEVATNGVVVAGDSHNAYATEMRLGDKQTGTPVAVSYDAPAISSPGLEQVLGTYAQYLQGTGYDLAEHSLIAANGPALKYTNLKDRGFILFSVTHTKHVGEYVFVNTDRSPTTNSNSNLLANSTYDLTHYCDARATATAGTPGQFSSVEAPQFFVPVQCSNKFGRNYYDKLF
eukprot:TRINITY_DN689_c0_g1_i5.p1 TRINITY_DN689_c0_g1~~TRINITY_DN689_c0_g1_i5.p1  ORF type:complete len:723 (+),score=227.93 TRINITY_DN689_c0_g1_i5:193-2169(+)